MEDEFLTSLIKVDYESLSRVWANSRCFLDLGFIEDIERIISESPRNKQSMLFSATISERILKLTKKFMTDPKFLKIGVEEQMTSYPGIFAGGDITNKRKDIIRGVADSGRASMGILLYLKELGKIERVPQRLTNYEGGPYLITYSEMEDKEAPGVSPNPTE